EMEAVRAANVLNGTDPNCGNWIMTYRDHKPAEAGTPASTAAPGASSGRRGGRAGRTGGGSAPTE
ncbi:MAG: methyltetrahydrofolate cobalamin methyltransferase, partial [Rhizobium rhizophilum]